MGSLLSLSEFQAEVDRIGRRAFQLFVAAARAWSDDEGCIRDIASLTDHLDTSRDLTSMFDHPATGRQFHRDVERSGMPVGSPNLESRTPVPDDPAACRGRSGKRVRVEPQRECLRQRT